MTRNSTRRKGTVRRAVQAASGWLALGVGDAALAEVQSLGSAFQWCPVVLHERARMLVALGEVAEARATVRLLAKLAPAWRLALLDDPVLEPIWT